VNELLFEYDSLGKRVITMERINDLYETVDFDEFMKKIVE
jgi:hypothetical protein